MMILFLMREEYATIVLSTKKFKVRVADASLRGQYLNNIKQDIFKSSIGKDYDCIIG